MGEVIAHTERDRPAKVDPDQQPAAGVKPVHRDEAGRARAVRPWMLAGRWRQIGADRHE